VTVCYPVNGRFSTDQAFVYNAVLAASRAVIAAMRPGVSWLDMHRLAERVIITHLLQRGLLRGSLETLLQRNVGALFMPHGLGHLIGLDTHDVGGWPARLLPRPTAPGIAKLRCGRVLEQGMVITVEPGCYFISELLEPAFATHGDLLVESEVRKFFGTGGVRIEDDVEVTADGARNLNADLPRTVQEIEDYMATHNPHVVVKTKH
jgi:Xaa-Pro dipeptidase